MRVTVPKACRDCQSGAVDGLDVAGDLYRRFATNRSDLPVPDEDDAVTYGLLRRTGIDRPADETQLAGRTARLALL